MTASCLFTPRQAPSVLAPVGGSVGTLRLPARLRVARRHGGLLVVLALLLLAALLAPEQPMAQASICERHNGAAACRVW